MLDVIENKTSHDRTSESTHTLTKVCGMGVLSFYMTPRTYSGALVRKQTKYGAGPLLWRLLGGMHTRIYVVSWTNVYFLERRSLCNIHFVHRPHKG